MKNNYSHTYKIASVMCILLLASVAAEVYEIIKDGTFGAALLLRTALSVLEFVLLIVIMNRLRLLFREIKAVETPFMKKISEAVKNTANTISICGLVYCAAGIICVILQEVMTIDNGFYYPSISFCLIVSFMGTAMYAFADIFEKGCDLQRESDETI